MSIAGNLKKLDAQYSAQISNSAERMPGKAALYLDFFGALLVHGSTISDYFQYRFWNKNHKERLQFMTARRNNRFYAKANDLEARNRLNNKQLFNQDFSGYLKRQWIALPKASKEEFVRFVGTNSPVFIKPCRLGAGSGIRKVYADQEEDLGKLYDELIQSGGYNKSEFVVEQTIRQNEKMASIHPQSVNTARILTFFDGDKVTIIGSALRCGVGDTFLDNHSANGIVAVIDPDTGVITSDGSCRKSLSVERHPDTGIVFRGFQMPFWYKATAMVKEAASSLKGIHYVGWDVAFLDSGVCLIEANPSAGNGILQEPYQKGCRPVYDWMLAELKKKQE